MRCPSCGNENPDDYTFCDECGAKLTPQGGEGTAPGATQDVVYAPTDDGGASAPLNAGAIGEEQVMAMATKPSGGVCPNCGAVTVPGEAYCNECGAELTSASSAAPAGDGAPDKMEPYMGATEANDQSGDASTGVPVSEDTMAGDTMAGDSMAGDSMAGDSMTQEAQTQAADAPQAEAAQEVAMPGVIPMEAMEDTGAAQAATMEEPVAMPEPIPEPMPTPMPSVAPETMSASTMSAGVGSASTAAWATDALSQLEEAQQSMAKGDWGAYGQSMGALKAFLESVVKGTAPQVAGMDVGAAPRPYQPVVDAATAAEIGSGGTAVPVPMPQGTPASGYAGTSAGAGTATGMARLVVIATGAEMPLPQQEEITVGREDPSSGIFPDIDLTPYGGEDGGVSRRHARLLHIGNEYYVEDLQSTNYTKLDGQRLPARVREKVEDGARLDFGRVAMIFRRG